MKANGARLALETAYSAGVEVCFANPGTTEMDLVSALDDVPGIRSVLCLFEGVATGAADGYGRIAGKPALTLLHLGPGFANGIANLHNARRAATPIVNLIGDHAQWHVAADAPLTSDIESLARPVSHFVQRPESPEQLARSMADAIGASVGPPSGVASLIVPQDVAWDEVDAEIPRVAAATDAAVDRAAIDAAASELLARTGEAGLLLGGVLDERCLESAARIQEKTGCRVWLDTFLPRLREGRGVPAFDALPYFPEQAIEALSGLQTLVTAGTRPPVAFFGYRNIGRSRLEPESCRSQAISAAATPPGPALEALAEAVGAEPLKLQETAPLPGLTDGPLDVASLGLALAHWLPADAILVNEAATSGLGWGLYGRSAAPHDTLSLTGGAIGQGIPNAVGAAIAAPDQRVVALQADGSGMYTVQGLWTLARENLDVTVVVCANRAYRILQAELGRSGQGEPGPVALGLTQLTSPSLDWLCLAEGMGIPGCRVERVDELAAALERRSGAAGPFLIEALL